MFIEKVNFPYPIPISYEGLQAGSCHLHSHKDVIEILMVIKGKAKMVISCENFEMNVGDYVVIRESDSHSFSAAESGCDIVSLYIRMQDYLDKIPYLYYVIFACESFDLAKYRNETVRIRNMIGSILLKLIDGDEESLKEAKIEADHLLWLLVRDYDMIKYYNRRWDVPFSKTEKYYVIMGYIFNHYFMRNIREFISQNEYYSKSYISHLFKEVGASSFKDMLDFVRVFRSEELLLDSDMGINDISDKCGFSDTKYYTANFKKWFHCTPSEYRRLAVKEVNKKSIFNQLEPGIIAEEIHRLSREEHLDTQYRAAITPISLKAFRESNQEQLVEKNSSCDEVKLADCEVRHEPQKHYILRTVGVEILSKSKAGITEWIESFESQSFTAVIMIDLRETPVGKCREIIENCVGVFRTEEYKSRRIIVLYNDLGEFGEINKIIVAIKKQFEFEGIRPLLMM